MLSLNEINSLMSELREWSLEQDLISRVFQFESFRKAIEFVNNVAELAEKHNHHPDIIISYNTVKLMLTTHQEKTLTKKDFELAKEIDTIK